MPVKSEKLAVAAKADELADCYAKVKATIDRYTIKPAWQAIDVAKLGQLMTTSKKPAEFVAALENAKKLTVLLRIGASATVLCSIDITAGRDNMSIRSLYQIMISQGSKLMTYPELTAFMDAHPEKEELDDLNGQISERTEKIKTAKEQIKALKAFNYANYNTAYPAGAFDKWVAAKHWTYYLDFVAAVDANANPQTIYDKYIKKGASFPMNLADPVRIAIEKDLQAKKKPNFGPAKAVIVKAIDTNIIPKFRTELLTPLEAETKHDEEYLATLQKDLKAKGPH